MEREGEAPAEPRTRQKKRLGRSLALPNGFKHPVFIHVLRPIICEICGSFKHWLRVRPSFGDIELRKSMDKLQAHYSK